MQSMIPKQMNEALLSFNESLALSLTDLTRKAYCFDVARFLQFLQEKSVKKLCTIKPLHVISYLSTLKSKHMQDSTINRNFMSLRAFDKFLLRNKLIEEKITDGIQSPKNQQKAPKILTKEEVIRILEQPILSSVIGLRDRAMLELLYSSGLRASELCGLDLDDYRQGSIRIKSGKRGKTRTIPITATADTFIRDYIQESRKSNYTQALFLTSQGKRIRRQLLCKTVTLYALDADIEDVSTHTLRHACATHLLDNGADLRLIQEVLGHSTIASTERYTHLSNAQMSSRFEQFHPRREVQNV